MRNDSYYMRSAKLIVVTSRSGVLLVGDGNSVVEHRTAHPAQWSQLMQQLANPLPGAVVEQFATSIPDLDNDLWGRLVSNRLVLQASDTDELLSVRDDVFSNNKSLYLVPGEPICEHLVLACTGSIVSGLMAPTILSLCYSRFQHNLDVILTNAAQKFVTRDLIESYGIRTWGDAFERREEMNVPHVQLAQSADCILVMPATANSLHRLAVGACTDLLSMVVAASTAPVVLAPAMNDAMWNNRAVQRNVQILREDGMYVIEPTIIFGAADLANQGKPMYGGHGTLWSGPQSLMNALSQILGSRHAQHYVDANADD